MGIGDGRDALKGDAMASTDSGPLVGGWKQEHGRDRTVGVAATQYLDQLGRLVRVHPTAVATVAAATGGPVPVRDAAPTVPLTMPTARRWGWQVQLYQMRGSESWGIGDYADLAELTRCLGAQGADVVLVNPLHADTPAPPFADSPYYPSSRRFVGQLGVAVRLLPEYEAADLTVREAVDELRPAHGPLIDRAAVWAAKLAALDLLFPGSAVVRELSDGDPDPVASRQFGVFCSLAERYGRSWRQWPPELRSPGPGADSAADPERVAFHVWIQVRAREQLWAAQDAARAAGMSVGIVHDLAVGVDPDGADSWLYQDALASGMRIGAPPDELNQLGQDWGLPAWRPDKLAEHDFAPWKAVVNTAFELGGGVRIDHVLGMSRLWWVPEGATAADGTYVSYDTEAMLGTVVDAARDHGALVIGEDLGTVDRVFRRRLAQLGVLGSAVLWFEGTQVGESRHPADWRREAAASVSTHDLPTAYGYLAGENVRIRAVAGILTVPVEQEQRTAAADRKALLQLLITEGVLDPADVDRSDRVVDAMYRALVLSPSLLVLAAPADAVGDLRQPNLPATVDEYPNWRLPLADSDGTEVSLADFLAAPGTARIARLLHDGLRQERGARVH